MKIEFTWYASSNDYFSDVKLEKSMFFDYLIVTSASDW